MGFPNTGKAQANEQRYSKLKEKYSELVQNHADLLRKVGALTPLILLVPQRYNANLRSVSKLHFYLFFLCVCSCLGIPEEGVRSSEAEVTGNCEPPIMGAGNQSWVL